MIVNFQTNQNPQNLKNLKNLQIRKTKKPFFDLKIKNLYMDALIEFQNLQRMNPKNIILDFHPNISYFAEVIEEHFAETATSDW